MKYFFLALTLIFSQFANAGNGKALIPHWESPRHVKFFVSNITSNPIEVHLKLYNEQGNIINIEGAGIPAKFILDPKTTKSLASDPNYVNFRNAFGFGSISWSNIGSDEDEVAITAVVTANGIGTPKLYINNGQPF
ncbi:hypothetical protein [Vibrio rotiferianus]|uniref:hypothetical protein n=1 Tax=Vibrio rotiferianus TaxID=190895 RepID=UPI0005EF130B|nr:hypothetical protein [Vibrio rotiferianus]